VTIANNTGHGRGDLPLVGAVPSATDHRRDVSPTTTRALARQRGALVDVTIRNSIFSQNGNINCGARGAAPAPTTASFGRLQPDRQRSRQRSVREHGDRLHRPSFDPQLAPLGSFGGTTRTRAPLGGSPPSIAASASVWRPTSAGRAAVRQHGRDSRGRRRQQRHRRGRVQGRAAPSPSVPPSCPTGTRAPATASS
jgi:hypothetical protein